MPNIKAPDQTTQYKKEPKPEKYVLPVAPELVDFIKQKKKMITYRCGLKYDYLESGDTVTIQNYDTKEAVAQAKITQKEKIKFSEIPLDTDGHETYRDKEQQRKVFSGYYAYLGREIQDDDLFLVLHFQLLAD